MITSRANPRIKSLAALQKKRERDASGRALAEGVHLAREALRAGLAETLVVSAAGLSHPEYDPIRAAAVKNDTEILEISNECYDKISSLQSPDGVAVLIRTHAVPLEELLQPADAKVVAAVGVQDPGNAGAIVRVAEAAGASGCIFLNGVDIFHPRFLRGSQGSSFRVPCSAGETDLFLNLCQKTGIHLLAADATDAVPYESCNYSPPMVLCVGSEGKGVPEAVLTASETRLAVPMKPPVESLNVAVATGIILYRARQGWT